ALGFAASAAAADWPRYGGDDLMTNAVPPERTGGVSAVTAPRVVEVWSTKLDGKIYASPLNAQGAEGAGLRRSLAYPLADAGTLYARRADDGDVVWQRQLGAVTVDGCAAEGRPAPVYGISSTGLIDRTGEPPLRRRRDRPSVRPRPRDRCGRTRLATSGRR